MPKNLPITAIICTHNRADYLEGALQSLLQQSLARDSHEILLVDNASTDRTPEVIAAACKQSHVQGLYEPLLGLSQARNSALRHARGRIVAFLDDDALAASDWLERILNEFDASDVPLGAVGGPVDPLWEQPRPNWLPEQLLPRLSLLDWSNSPLLVDHIRTWLAGANVALLREPLERIGGFDTRLGRLGRCLRSGEEQLALWRLECAGFRSLYHPGVRVRHRVPPERLRKRWFLMRSYWNGQTRAYLRSWMLPTDAGAGMPPLRQELLARLRVLRSTLDLRRPAVWFGAGCSLASLGGYVLGRLQLLAERVSKRGGPAPPISQNG